MSMFLPAISRIRKLTDPFDPSGDPNAPSNADWSGGATPSFAGGSDPYSPQPSLPSIQSNGPDINKDIYLPRMQQVEQGLESAYAPPTGKLNFVRQLLGSVLARKNPQLGAVISGQAQREAKIAPLEREYGLLQNIMSQNRAQSMQDLNTQNIQSEISDRAAQAALRNKQANAPAKVTPDEATWEGYLKANGNDPVKAHQALLSDAQAAKPEKPPPNMKAVTVQLPNGKKAPGKTDEQGNILLADGTKAPEGTMLYQQPNYGQLVLPTKTQTMLGPDNLPHDFSWNAQTQKFDIDQGISTAGAYGHEMTQAGAVQRGGGDLISELKDPSNREVLGKLSSYVKSGTLGTPLADAKAAKLSAELKTFAALQPAMHGFRSRSAQEAFEKMIGGLAQSPDATIGSIEGILQTAGAINPAGAQTTTTPSTGAPPPPRPSRPGMKWQYSPSRKQFREVPQ